MIKRIPIAALKVGMYISDLNNDWIPHNTQRKKGVIKREETIEKIRRMGVQYVYIDVEKGLDAGTLRPPRKWISAMNRPCRMQVNSARASSTRLP